MLKKHQRIIIKTSTNSIVTSSNSVVDKHDSKPSTQDTAIRDLKPIFFVCRFFGQAPYTISNTSISLSSIGVIYSGMVMIYSVYLIWQHSKVLYYENMDNKLKYLIITRIILLLLNTCAETILSILWHGKLQNFLSKTYYNSKVEKLEEKKNNYFLTISLILIIVIMTFHICMSVISYLFQKYAIVYFTMNQAMAFSLLKFLSIMMILRRRFQNLNEYLMAGL